MHERLCALVQLLTTLDEAVAGSNSPELIDAALAILLDEDDK